MKKLYTLALAAVVALTASAVGQKQLSGKLEAQQNLTLKNSAKEALATATATTSGPKRAAEEGEWVKTSTGIWFEGPLAARFSDVDEGQWEVDIYENEAQPGWIRLNPYGEDTQPALLLGRANTVDLEINVSNPDQCYFLDWTPWGSFTYGSYCAENDWNGQANYGKLVDGTITFAAGTVAYYNSGWDFLNSEIKIVLDKETYVDYSLDFIAPFCGSAEDSYFGFFKGDGIETVLFDYLEGYYPMNDQNAQVIAAYGEDITEYEGYKVSLDLYGTNTEWSLLYVGLDKEGNIKAQGAVYTWVVEDDADNWKKVGNATYTEGVLSNIFTNIDSEDLKCTIEENITTPGYYRLVNPYDDNTFASNEGHNHYLYINATDKDLVYIEPSPLGAYIGSSWGYAATDSWGYIYYYNDMIEEGKELGVWGTLENGVITVPGVRIQLSNYQNADFLSLGLDATIKVAIELEAPTHSWSDKVDANNSVSIPGNTVIDLTAGEGENIYYAWEITAAAETENAPARVPAESEFTLLTDDTKPVFAATKEGETHLLHYYSENPENGFRSPVTTLAVVHDGTTGLENIAVDAAAPAEYFNLQGIRVNNPAAGQILIRRQGSKVEKVYVK
ncbi:MAG: hypothetical protein NC098_05295 [Lachnoclostridium sp.]|nr:hypothetical protein [Lachnoclostridium sp.]